MHQIEEEREAKRKAQQRQDWERSRRKVSIVIICIIMYHFLRIVLNLQFRLFCRHPVTKELMEKCLEVHKNTKLCDAVAEAHKVQCTCVTLIATCSLSSLNSCTT